MTETREQVFEDLLESWRSDEASIIGEGLDSRPNAEQEADREMEEWRKRYREAQP
jgi:hypothetical protein